MWDPAAYQFAIDLFFRGLGLIYFVAFAPFLFQIRGLFGSAGILPVCEFLQIVESRFGSKRYWYIPSIFWLNSSDTMLVVTTAVGALSGLLLFLVGYPALFLPICWLLYLSIIAVGQDFLSFGWEIFLMEISINAIFLSWCSTPNLWIWISLNILLFRFHLQAGAVKLQSGDATWADWTALSYHYQTQPIPNTQAWYAHKLPLWFHKFSCANMFVIELIVPFALFGTAEMRLFVWGAFVGLQLTIWFTGNFSYLNYLSAAFSTILLHGKFIGAVKTTPTPILIDTLVSAIGVALITLQLLQLYHHFFPSKGISKILSYCQFCHIVNRYGIFAVMTTKRYEVVVEGSDDGEKWKEYLFKYKPSEITRRPRRIAPYQPRLDWQLWFLPFSTFDRSPWFQHFLLRLLQGSSAVESLLRYNPFPDQPPKYIRALLYDYTFSDWKTRKLTGAWWKRDLIGNYSREISLK